MRLDDPHDVPKTLDDAQFRTLRVLVEHLVPGATAQRIDLAARIDARLSSGAGDGWRHASLPDDASAYRRGLRTLDRRAAATGSGDRFDTISPERREHMLSSIANGTLDDDAVPNEVSLTLEPLRLWFEDVRGEAVKTHVAHPATLAAIGYSGIGDGDDAEHQTGFVSLGIGAVEAWEPAGRNAGTQ